MTKLEDARAYAEGAVRELGDLLKTKGIYTSVERLLQDEPDYHMGRARACKAYIDRMIMSELDQASDFDILTPPHTGSESDSWSGPAFTKAHELALVQESLLRNYILDHDKEIPDILPSTKQYRKMAELFGTEYDRLVAEDIGQQARKTPSCSPTEFDPVSGWNNVAIKLPIDPQPVERRVNRTEKWLEDIGQQLSGNPNQYPAKIYSSRTGRRNSRQQKGGAQGSRVFKTKATGRARLRELRRVNGNSTGPVTRENDEEKAVR
jgi:hypothetical protein